MQPGYFRGLVTACATMLACCLFAPLPAYAISKADILEPYQDSLAQCKAALQELEHQTGLHVKELEEGLAFLEERRKDLDAAAARLRQEFEAQQRIMDREVLAGWQMVSELVDPVHIPGHGFVTMEELRQHRDARRGAIQEQLKLLEDGELQLHIDGIGMLSLVELEERLEQRRKELEMVRQTIEAGEYVMYYPGLGEVDRKRLEAHKGLLEERIAAISEQIAAGDFVVILPGLGPVSKNGLKARIEKLKQDMKDLQQRFDTGVEKILRASIQWSDATQVAMLAEDLQEQKKQLLQQVKDQSREFLLPVGWVSGQSLKASIEKERQAMEQTQKALLDRSYEVALPDGTWASEKQLEKALINAVIAPDIREALEKGRKNIGVTAGLEIEQCRIRMEVMQNWLDGLADQAGPHLARLDLELKWKKAMLDEFRREEKAATRWMQEELRWLERCMRYLP